MESETARNDDSPGDLDLPIPGEPLLAGLEAGVEHASYRASERAVRRIPEVAAIESARLGFGIHMNSLHPGIGQVDIGEAPAQRFVDVGFASESNVREALESMHPMGSPGEATDVAAGVGFPACDASRPPDLPPAIGLP